MNRSQRPSLLVIGLLLMPGVLWGKETPFVEMSSHYEAVRQALLEDSMRGVTEHGKAIQDLAGGLLENVEAARASVPEPEAAQFMTTLDEIQSAASGLSAADSLASAREEFFALTKPMARYRRLRGDQKTLVAYCPMAEKAWIQPEGEIGNPYLGQEMPKCGEVVSESRTKKAD